jgi:hypothetical protein
MQPDALEPRAVAADLSRRIVQWLGGIRDADDLSPDGIARGMGIAVEIDPAHPDRYAAFLPIGAHWRFALTSLPKDGAAAPDRVMLSFDDLDGGFADMSPVCAVGFDDYARALEAAGYTGAVVAGARGAFRHVAFTRDRVEIRLLLRAESAAKPGHLCVSRLIVEVLSVDTLAGNAPAAAPEATDGEIR